MFEVEIKRKEKHSKSPLHSGQIPKINLRHIDWKCFDAALNVDLGMAVNYDEKSTEEKIHIITQILQRAEQDSAPAYKASRITPRWWRKELDELRKKKVANEIKLQKARKKYGPEHEVTAGIQEPSVGVEQNMSNHCVIIKRNHGWTWLNDPQRMIPGTSYIRC